MKVHAVEPWCFATRPISAMRMYFFDVYIDEVLAKHVPDYVAFSHAGHGINSYAINDQLVDGPLAILAQVGWGGVYSSAKSDTQRVNDLFARCARLVSAANAARRRGLTGPPGRLVVVESELRGICSWGWRDRPKRGLSRHKWLANLAEIPEGDLPTLAALRWLESGPQPGLPAR